MRQPVCPGLGCRILAELSSPVTRPGGDSAHLTETQTAAADSGPQPGQARRLRSDLPRMALGLSVNQLTTQTSFSPHQDFSYDVKF